MQPDGRHPELPAKFAPLGLTYDDVLLVPGPLGHHAHRGRHQHAAVARDPAGIPLVSAAMDTVTEARMAIAMARAGRHRHPAPQPLRSRTRPRRPTW